MLQCRKVSAFLEGEFDFPFLNFMMWDYSLSLFLHEVLRYLYLCQLKETTFFCCSKMQKVCLSLDWHQLK